MDINKMTDAEIRVAFAAMQTRIKDAEAARKDELSVLGSEFFAHVLETGAYTESQSSAWVGVRENAIPFTHTDEAGEEKAYTVSLSITDVAAKAVRLPLFPRTKADSTKTA
jgi:hypothetical protein